MGTRTRLLAGLDRAMLLGAQQKKMRMSGQTSLFGAIEETTVSFDLPRVPDLPQEELLHWEKELLGFYLSAHPLAHMENLLRERVTTFIPALSEEWAGQPITLGGRVVEVRRIITKKGLTMAIVQFEDLLGNIEITVFPRTYAEFADHWQEEKRLFVTGKLEIRDEEVRLIAEKVEVIAFTEEELHRRLHHLSLRLIRSGNDAIDLVKVNDVMNTIRSYPGRDTIEFLISVPSANNRVAVVVPSDNHVRYCPELQSALESLLGSGAVNVCAQGDEVASPPAPSPLR